MKFGTPELRKKLRRYHQENEAAFERWRRGGYRGNSLLPVYPPECRGMACGARSRKGTPCKNLSIYANGRCKFHGGLSTGPKTEAGKRKVAANGRRAGKAHGELTKDDMGQGIGDCPTSLNLNL